MKWQTFVLNVILSFHHIPSIIVHYSLNDVGPNQFGIKSIYVFPNYNKTVPTGFVKR